MLLDLNEMDRTELEMKSLPVVMTVLVVSSGREWKSGGYNSGYYWDRDCDFFLSSEGYDLSPFVTLRDPRECADNPYNKSNTGYKPEVSKYSGATCGWITPIPSIELRPLLQKAVQ